MKCYTQEEVREDLPGIVLMSHGPFAVSLVETAKMLFGDAGTLQHFPGTGEMT